MLPIGIRARCCELRRRVHWREAARLARRRNPALRDRSRPIPWLHLQPWKRALEREYQLSQRHVVKAHTCSSWPHFRCSFLPLNIHHRKCSYFHRTVIHAFDLPGLFLQALSLDGSVVFRLIPTNQAVYFRSSFMNCRRRPPPLQPVVRPCPPLLYLVSKIQVVLALLGTFQV